MGIFDRTNGKEHVRVLAICAAVGTALLSFVPSGFWLNGAAAPEKQLYAVLLKQLLTVLLLAFVPALWARLAHRTKPWILLFLTGLAFGGGLFFTNSVPGALYTVLLIALPGAGLYVLERLRLSNFRVVIYESLLILAALFGYACLPDLIRQGDAYVSARWLIRLYEQILDGLGSQYKDAGGEQVLSVLKEQLGLYRMNAEAITVSVLMIPAMTAGLLNTLASHRLNRDGAVALSALPRFSDWRCERWYVLMAAALSLVTLLLQLFGAQHADALSSVAESLWRMPCALAGVCAVRRIAERIGKTWIFWFAIGLLFLLPSITIMILSLLGALSSLRGHMHIGEDGVRK